MSIWICPICRGTMRWNNERFVCPICGYDDTPKQKPVTNADRIRSMSDEEMAEWASAITLDEFGDKKDWLNWLKQEGKR